MAVFAYLGEVHAFNFSRKLPAKSMKLCTLFFAMLTNCIVALSWHNCLHEACTSTNFFHNFQVSHFQYESAWAIYSLLRRANAWNVSFRDSSYPIIPPTPHRRSTTVSSETCFLYSLGWCGSLLTFYCYYSFSAHLK